MNNFLAEIKASVLARANDIQLPSTLNINALDFCKVFNNPTRPAIIAELKFASPSRGVIYHGGLDPVAIAEAYLANGAAAISILTEPVYFKGEIAFVRKIRQKFPDTPLLLKDFVLHKSQIAQALHYGANAVLLIVAFLEQTLFEELYHYAISLGLTPLIEVNTIDELTIALSVKPKLIGINNRNLNTLVVDLDTSRRLIQSIPKDIHIISASGITTSEQLQEMTRLGFQGFLVGTGLMTQDDPGLALQELLAGEHHAH